MLVEDGQLLNCFVLGCTAESQRCLPERTKSRLPVVHVLEDLFSLLPSMRPSHTSTMDDDITLGKFQTPSRMCQVKQNKLNLYSQPNHMNLVNSLDMALLYFSASRSEPEKVKVERVVNI